MSLKGETVETLEAAALHLPPGERALLVQKLIASFDRDPEVEATWATEVERREAQIESRGVSLLRGPETLAKLKADLGIGAAGDSLLAS